MTTVVSEARRLQYIYTPEVCLMPIGLLKFINNV